MKKTCFDIFRGALMALVLLSSICAMAQPDFDDNVQSRNSSGLINKHPYLEIVNKGLGKRVCHHAIEDRNGFIWVSTNNGVARYDGLRFETFFSTESRDHYVNDISAICEDTINHCIWAAFSRRLELACIDYYTFEKKIIKYNIELDLSTFENFIVGLYNYNDTLLMSSTRSGHILLHKQTGEVIGPFDSDKTAHSRMLHMAGYDYMVSRCDSIGDNLTRLCRIVERSVPKPRFEWIDIDTGVFTNLRHIDQVNDSILMLELSTPIARNQSGQARFIFCRYNVFTGNTKVIYNGHGRPKDFVCMDDGIWYSTNGKDIKMFDYATQQVDETLARNLSVSFSNVNSFCRLRNQSICFICSGEGLVKNDYYTSRFNVVDLRRVTDSRTCNSFLIHKDFKGGYWTWIIQDGLYHRKPDSFLFLQEDIRNGRNEQWGFFGCVDDTIHALTYFRNVYRILCYDHKTGKTSIVVDCLSKDRNKATSAINDFQMIDNGRILFSCGSNVCIYDPQKKSSSVICSKKESPITKVHYDGDSIVWICDRRSQLYSYNMLNSEMRLHATVGESTTNILGIHSQVRDNIREIWICCVDGLYYYLPSKRHLSKVEYGNVLNDALKSMVVDSYKNVWVASSNRVVCINNSNGCFYEYDLSDYNVNIDFNTSTAELSPDGTVLMAGQNGFVEFRGNDFITNDYFPAPVVGSYKYMNSMSNAYDAYTVDYQYGRSDTIVIPTGIRAMELNVRVLNYSNSEKNKFQWRALDWSTDTDWKTVNAGSSILFSNMPRGISRVELRSCDLNGYPTQNVRTLYINNLVFFYENPEFWILIGIAMILVVFALALYKNAETKRRRRYLEQEVARQAGALQLVNTELMRNQHIIELQNDELRQHKMNLEQEVADRTADLEVARQKAEESSRLKSAFLANLSHEVRTPMNCIVGFSKLLADPECSADDRREFIHLIQESSQGMLVLISDLLDVSRIESGQLRVNMKYFNVAREIHDVYSMLFVARKFPNVEFKLEADLEAIDRELYSDKDRFRQVIINICCNAFKFTESGHVAVMADIIRPSQLADYAFTGTIPSSLNCDLLLVRIEDSGIGIPADKMEVIFEPFRKLNNNKTLYPGLGLGLNIVKNLITLLKGQIWLTSRADIADHGTTFYFYLPFNEDPPLEQQRKE
ncbi:MAG: HAMP domain-containing histidine kinase [Bacteroidales bacterium]|nr:HAMP domain-containing histidine kinase [Bacteroidales bacterium]